MASSRDLPNLGIQPVSLTSLALAGRFFTSSATWEALSCIMTLLKKQLHFSVVSNLPQSLAITRIPLSLSFFISSACHL